MLKKSDMAFHAACRPKKNNNKWPHSASDERDVKFKGFSNLRHINKCYIKLDEG